VVVSIITAEGEIKMNEVAEKAANAAKNEGSAPPVEPLPAKRPHVAAHPRHVASSKRASAIPATKANKGAKSGESRKKAARVRQGSKTAKFLDLLKRSGGATGTDPMKAAG
jgi:hypothetical protein